MTTEQTIELLEKEKARIIEDIDKKLAFQKTKLESEKMKEDFKVIKYKGKEFRIYRWENKEFKDFPMPEGFSWCKYFDFLELINEEKVNLEQYPACYYTENQFKKNIKRGYGLSWFFLNRGLNLNSDKESLADSDGSGRAVISKEKKC